MSKPTAVSTEDLSLDEAGFGLAGDQTGPDGQPLGKGLYKVHIIRPGVGRGRGRHLYEADMLKEHAGIFKGWKMFVDHLSPEARKAAGGMPRRFAHLGGSIKEAWWDPNVPEDPQKGHGKGAIVGVAKPVGLAKRILEDDPEIAELSISAHATGVRGVTHKGERVKLVEGIHPEGSVDWVTQAGAGGKVVGLCEALIEEGRFDDMGPGDLLEWLEDDQLEAFVRDRRPELAEALGLLQEEPAAEEEPEPEPEPAAVEEPEAERAEEAPEAPEAEKAENLLPNDGQVQEAAVAATDTSAEGGDDMGITPDQLREALSDPETREMLKGIIAEDTAAALSEQATEFETRSELIRAEARADADRAIQLTRLERQARNLISEAQLPEGWTSDLLERYQIDEAGCPTAALDAVDEVDGEGNVTKRASQVLTEAVEADVSRLRGMLEEVRPTRVRGQGTQATAGQRADERVEEAAVDGGQGGEPERQRVQQDKPYWMEYLDESGIDSAKAYPVAG